MGDGRPHPVPDQESGPFWAGLHEGRVVLQACVSCGRRRFPRMPSCPYCGSEDGVDVDCTGHGSVYSWIGVQRALTPGFESDVPYTVLTVDLDGGGRMFGRLEGAMTVTIGMRVSPAFVDHDDWCELRFRADETDARGGA